MFTVHSEIKQKHKHIKDYNVNYILTKLIKGGKCLLAIFHEGF